MITDMITKPITPDLTGAVSSLTDALPRPANLEDCLPCWAKLERLGWAGGIAFDSYGTRLGIRVTDPAVLPRIAALLPPGWAAAGSPVVEGLYSLKIGQPDPRRRSRPYHLLYQGIGRLARTPDFEELLGILESDLHAQVAAHARGFLFVHAGVVGWQGRAIVLPGRSFSGKTSLVAALVRAGATYYSDEYAVLDAEGQVHPYPKPLSLRGEDGSPAGTCTAEELGGQSGGPALPIGLIASAKYQPPASWRPRPLSPGQTLMALLDNTVQVRRQPEQALAILQKAASSAAGFKSRRGEADTAAAWILKRLEN